MSDNIPFEIQIEIIKKLPIRSLIQFRSISKAWKSLIDSSDFILHYHNNMQHLLVSFDDLDDFDRKYISFVDDHTFPQHSVSLPLHSFVKKMLNYSDLIGSSHGLLCLYRLYLKGRDNNSISGRGMAVIWNPCIRKAVAVVLPNAVAHNVHKTVLGFGVSPGTTDPKIVKINCIQNNTRWIDGESISNMPWQVEVFALSTGAWRRPYGVLPRKSIRFGGYAEVDGILYWRAEDMVLGFSICNLIVSFDLTTEEFSEVNLPDSLAHRDKKLFISKLRESLIVLDWDGIRFYDVWMMEDGVSKSFTKLFAIGEDTSLVAYIHGFRKSGEPILEASDNGYCSQLVVYKPNSKQFDYVGIEGSYLTFSVSSYIETLLLLDQPDLTVYNENQTFRYRDGLFQELNLFCA